MTGGNIATLGGLYAFGLLGAFALSSISLDRVRMAEGQRGLLFAVGVATTVMVLVAWRDEPGGEAGRDDFRRLAHGDHDARRPRLPARHLATARRGVGHDPGSRAHRRRGTRPPPRS